VRRIVVAMFVLLGCTHAHESRSAGHAHRVVSLTPSLTETVDALGAADLLVGVDEYSTHPDSVRSLPKVGNFLQPNLEAILDVTPDIVLADDVQTLRLPSEIKIFSIPMQTVADVRHALLTVGDALGKDEIAKQIVARLDGDLDAAARAIPSGAPRPRVLFVVDRRPDLTQMVAAGPGTYLDELIQRAGGDNVLAGAGSRYEKISVEEVLTGRPDVILDATHTEDAAESARARTDWDTLTAVPAVQQGRVHMLDAMFVTPGQRLGEALRKLVALVHASP
jgi:iron complex transport system substrate-binding protein